MTIWSPAGYPLHLPTLWGIFRWEMFNLLSLMSSCPWGVEERGGGEHYQILFLQIFFKGTVAWHALGFYTFLISCFLTVCHLDVKPVWWFVASAAFCWLIWHAVVAIRCLLVSCCCSMHTYCAVNAVRILIMCCCCSPHPNAVRIATIHCYRRKQLIHVIFSVLTVAVCTLILCGLEQ